MTGAASPRLLAALARRDALALAIFAIGIGVAAYGAELNRSPNETGQAAMTLLDQGFIGNPYLLPTGPSAHVSPTLIGILALVYAAFGENTPAARLALGVLAAGLYALSVAVALRLCEACRPGPGARRIAMALFVLVPFFLFWSVVYNRQWDQPFSALILVLGWLVYERARTDPRPYRAEAKLAALAGIGALFSPALLAPLLLGVAGTIWRRRAVQAPWRAALLAACIVAACLLPWGVRNQMVLGEFILARSNGALELATGNAPDANGVSGSSAIGKTLHPHDSPAAAAEVARVGELAYMRDMHALVVGWWQAEPRRLLALSLRRVVLTFLPARRLVPWHPLVPTLLPWALLPWAVLLLFGALRLAALGAALVLRQRPLEGAVFTVLPLAPYFVTHVNIRYLYLVYFTSVVLIAVVLDSAWRRFRPLPSRRAPYGGAARS